VCSPAWAFCWGNRLACEMSEAGNRRSQAPGQIVLEAGTGLLAARHWALPPSHRGLKPKDRVYPQFCASLFAGKAIVPTSVLNASGRHPSVRVAIVGHLAIVAAANEIWRAYLGC